MDELEECLSRKDPMRKWKNRDDVAAERVTSGRTTAPCAVEMTGPHRIEEDVQRELLGHAGLKFSSLVVRRIRNGVCLEGVLEADDDAPDVGTLAQTVVGVEEVLNHLVVRHQGETALPAKG